MLHTTNDPVKKALSIIEQETCGGWWETSSLLYELILRELVTEKKL